MSTATRVGLVGCIAGQAGLNGNSPRIRFLRPRRRDLTIDEASPCAPPVGRCGLIGLSRCVADDWGRRRDVGAIKSACGEVKERLGRPLLTQS